MKFLAIPEDITEQTDVDLTKDDRCRTCVHYSNRIWKATPEEQHAALWGKVKPEALRCTPSQGGEITGIYSIKFNQEPYITKIEQTRLLDENKASVLSEQPDVRSVVQVVGINSCGQLIQDKCLGCRNLERVATHVPWTEPNGRVRYRQIVIAARCGLGPEGKRIGDKVKMCHFEPKPSESPEPSCWNCEFLGSPASVLDDYTRTPVKIDLNRYERWQTRKVMAGAENPGAVYNAMRMKYCNMPHGMLHTFSATVIETIDDLSQFVDTEPGVGYYLKFDQNNLSFFISANDPHVHIRLCGPNNSRAAVEIMNPHHERFSLRLAALARILVLPEAPERYEFFVPTHIKIRYNPSCLRCDHRKEVPCDSHARLLRKDYDSGSYVFDDPSAHIYYKKETDPWNLSFDSETSKVIAADNKPVHPRIFRVKLNELIAKNPTFETEIRAQLKDVMRKCRSRTVPRDIGWAYPITHSEREKPTEIFKRQCDHPSGLDFREIFGDTFGLTRDQTDKSWAVLMENESLMRAGITPGKAGEREFSTAKLHEEIVLNDAAYSDYIVPFEGFKSEPVTIFLDSFGNEVTGIENQESLKEFQQRDRKAYMNWLDEITVTKHTEVVTDEDTKSQMTTTANVYVTNRARVHGYDIIKHAKRGRNTAKGGAPMSPNDVFKLQDKVTPFSDPFESGVTSDIYRCLHCSDTFAYDTPGIELGNLKCPTCVVGNLIVQDPERKFNYIPGKPHRDAKGLGLVVLRERPAWLEQTRLLSMSCPHWVKRGSPINRPVTIRDQKQRTKWVNVEFIGIKPGPRKMSPEPKFSTESE